MPKQPSLFPQKRGPIKQKRPDVFEINSVCANIIVHHPERYEEGGLMCEWARAVLAVDGGTEC